MADIHDTGTASAEVTAMGRIGRAGHIALKDDTLARLFNHGIGNRHSGEQRLGVRMFRILIERIACGQLNHLAKIHDGDTVSNVTYHGKIMGDEQIGEPKFFLQILQAS